MKSGYYSADTFEAIESLGFLVRRTATLMAVLGEDAMGRLDPPMTLTQWIVLMRLRTDASLSASVLAEQIGHNAGALTRVIDDLAGGGLVLRKRSSGDRRGVQLSLTAKGRRLIEAQLPKMLERLNLLLESFERSEVTQLHALLKRLIGGLEALQTAADGATESRKSATRPRRKPTTRSQP